MELAVEILEALTIFCFGISWPLSIRKSYVSRTSKGKSLMFELFVETGYLVGIARKIIQVAVFGNSGFVFYLGFLFYILNFAMIAIDIGLYFRNVKLDKQRELEVAQN